jgi:hypothetical protein
VQPCGDGVRDSFEVFARSRTAGDRFSVCRNVRSFLVDEDRLGEDQRADLDDIEWSGASWIASPSPLAPRRAPVPVR